MRYLFISLSCLAAAVAGCEKPGSGPAVDRQPKGATDAAPLTQPQPAATGELSPGAVDACALLTREEAASIIGEPVTDTQTSGKSAEGLDISQCYIAATTPANSVSLVVTQKGTGTETRDPREQWEQTFDTDRHDDDEKEDRERKPPEKVEGLGDAAFWIANPIGSALYVLKANTYVRISIGGAADQAAKLEKSKAIAHLMLNRL